MVYITELILLELYEFIDLTILGRVDLCYTHDVQQYIGNHIIANASDTILA